MYTRASAGDVPMWLLAMHNSRPIGLSRSTIFSFWHSHTSRAVTAFQMMELSMQDHGNQPYIREKSVDHFTFLRQLLKLRPLILLNSDKGIYSYIHHIHHLNCDTKRCDIRIQSLPHKRHTLRQTLGVKLSSLDCGTKGIHGFLEGCSCVSGVDIHALEHSVIGELVAH